MEERRECNKCGKVKTLDEFHRDRRRSLGVRPVCKACVSAYMKERYMERSAEDRDRHNAYQRRNYRYSPRVKEYYAAKWKSMTKEQRDERNARRRKQYADSRQAQEVTK